MRDTRKILVSVLVVLLAIAVCTVAYASNVSYHSNGKPSSIVTDKGTIHYNDKGIVESVTTPSGTAHYNEDGSISSIVGTPSISLEEAKLELKNLEKNDSNTTTPKDDVEEMPVTGVEDYLFVPMVLFVVLAVMFGIRYNSLRKI